MQARIPEGKTVSFFIGVITVIVVAVLVFKFVQSNNFRTVLGAHTQVGNNK